MRYYSRHTQFISYEPSRREPWRGHMDKTSVRRTIAHHELNGGTENLVFFAFDIAADGQRAYFEISREHWSRYFAD